MGIELELIDKIKYLGVVIDSNLTWQYQISNIYKNVAPRLNLLRRLKNTLPQELLIKIYKTYMLPILDYGCTIWGLSSDQNIAKIQKIHNLIGRIITGNFDFINARGLEIVQKLGWQTFRERRDYLICNLVFKCIHGMSPNYLSDNFNSLKDIGIRNTRGSDELNLYTPLPKIEMFRHSLCYAGAQLWNNLPDDIKMCRSIFSFKKKYKTTIW